MYVVETICCNTFGYISVQNKLVQRSPNRQCPTARFVSSVQNSCKQPCTGFLHDTATRPVHIRASISANLFCHSNDARKSNVGWRKGCIAERGGSQTCSQDSQRVHVISSFSCRLPLLPSPDPKPIRVHHIHGTIPWPTISCNHLDTPACDRQVRPKRRGAGSRNVPHHDIAHSNNW